MKGRFNGLRLTGIIALTLSILLLSGTAVCLGAVDVGGEIKTSTGLSIDREGDITAFHSEEIKLELLIPDPGRTEPKFDIKFYHDTLTGDSGYFIRKLYLKHNFANFQLTAGRQPVSWSFGSLLNPVDYNPGAVVMDETTSGKFIDAVEGYIPLNWNSGLTLVTSFPAGTDELKWGVRGRTGFKGYDLNLSIVGEPEISRGGYTIPAADRIGFSFKGDLGPAGIYGSAGYYRRGEADGVTYQLGTDYSRSLNYGNNKINYQLEYLNIDSGNLNEIVGGLIPAVNLTTGEKLDLILGSVSYELDQFSGITLMGVASIDDSSGIIIPSYRNQLGSNLDLNIRTAFYLGEETTLFGAKEIAGGYSVPAKMMEISLSYPF